MIDSHTQIYGIIGYPVRHSFSPQMHNAAFKAAKLNARYLAFEVTPHNLSEALSGIRSLGICGLNITIPHKEAVASLIDSLDPTAKLIGAVNTIHLKDGKLIGYNTDGRGFIRALKEELKIIPAGRRFFIFGAGGAARAVGFNLAKEGAKKIAFYDALRPKAEKLALDLRHNFPNCKVQIASGLPLPLLEDFDCLVNATPCGMKNSDPLIVDPRFFHPGLIVCDLIYNPLRTKLLKAAQAKRLKTMNGLGMLLYQGVISWEIWTGKKAPVGIMKKVLTNIVTR
jgi:shikimate dehydrogenase